MWQKQNKWAKPTKGYPFISPFIREPFAHCLLLLVIYERFHRQVNQAKGEKDEGEEEEPRSRSGKNIQNSFSFPFLFPFDSLKVNGLIRMFHHLWEITEASSCQVRDSRPSCQGHESWGFLALCTTWLGDLITRNERFLTNEMNWFICSFSFEQEFAWRSSLNGLSCQMEQEWIPPRTMFHQVSYWSSVAKTQWARFPLAIQSSPAGHTWTRELHHLPSLSISISTKKGTRFFSLPNVDWQSFSACWLNHGNWIPSETFVRQIVCPPPTYWGYRTSTTTTTGDYK